MPTLLLELFSEEIPSRMQKDAASQLSQLLFKQFQLALNTPADPMGSKDINCKQFVSPRHLAISITGLPLIQPDYVEERRGPKIGAPEQALKGFLNATGLTLEQCEQRDGYYYANIERKGRATTDVAKELIEYTLANFSWPKSMRWGARPLNWVRPLHRIVALLDDKIVPVTFAHLTASNVTEGHRFLAPAPISIAHAEQYEEVLKSANVIVDFAARREKIAADIAAVASAAKLTVVEDDALLNEVTGLVEWPVPLLCQFDAKFLDLPREVLISEMKNHQRYFALNDASGNLSTQFITVANMVNADGGAKVIEGNGRVVRARLSDGEFYWNQDRLVSLEDWGKKLSDVVFHAKVGMMDAKVARIEKLALQIAEAVGYEKDMALVQRAAQLCKADLTSGMVGEFPELQGIMGRYYAKQQNEHQLVAEAIYDHYKPQGAGDSLPENEIGSIISIADKLDSIVSLFAAGEKPTGSKDPLALRRAALGVLKILLQKNWAIDLNALGCNSEVIWFFEDRLRALFLELKIHYQCIDAVMHDTRLESKALDTPFIPCDLIRNAKALQGWLTTEAGKTTLAAIKRTLNLLAAEEKKAKTKFAAKGFESLALPAEKALIAALKSPFKTPADLEALAAPINAFFDRETGVQVTEPEFREARLSLLAAVRDAANQIADFSKIEG
jgi:glycyl-tRNA synthetase beta chain